jgi:hypothetical protein
LIPNYLLISFAEFFNETTVSGTFGEQVQAFQSIGTVPVRVDQGGTSRSLHAGKYEETSKTLQVYCNELPPDVTEKTWARITSKHGYLLTCQVSSIRYPGLMGHHSELSMVEKSGVTLP